VSTGTQPVRCSFTSNAAIITPRARDQIACVAVSSAGDFVGIGDAASRIKVWAVPRSAEPCLNQRGAVGALEAKFGAQAHQG
jgi:hypothetical protein